MHILEREACLFLPEGAIWGMTPCEPEPLRFKSHVNGLLGNEKSAQLLRAVKSAACSSGCEALETWSCSALESSSHT